MCEAIPPLPQYTFMPWCAVKKAQEQLYLHLYEKDEDPQNGSRYPG
jgi:hypothetical protein